MRLMLFDDDAQMEANAVPRILCGRMRQSESMKKSVDSDFSTMAVLHDDEQSCSQLCERLLLSSSSLRVEGIAAD